MRKLVSLTTVAASMLNIHASAALLAYESFSTAPGGYDASGGYANPSEGPSNALVWDSDTTTGDSVGQSPPVPGLATTGWTQFSTTNQSSSIYPRVQAAQSASYTTSSQQLDTTLGEVSIFRDGGTSTAMKSFARSLNIGVSGGGSATYGSTLYMSGIVRFTDSLASTMVRSASSMTDGSSGRPFGMNIGADGSVELYGSGATTVSTAAGTVTANQSYFFVWKLEDNSLTGNTGDRLTLYLNPTDLSSEGANTSTLATPAGSSSTTNFFVSGNSAWTLRDLVIGAAVDVDQEVIFDEFRIGNTWEDVAPFALIPEPATGALALVGSLALLRRRRN